MGKTCRAVSGNPPAQNHSCINQNLIAVSLEPVNSFGFRITDMPHVRAVSMRQHIKPLRVTTINLFCLRQHHVYNERKITTAFTAASVRQHTRCSLSLILLAIPEIFRLLRNRLFLVMPTRFITQRTIFRSKGKYRFA